MSDVDRQPAEAETGAAGGDAWGWESPTRRRFLGGVGAAAVTTAVASTLLGARPANAANAIVVENLKAGAPNWASGSISPDNLSQVTGYARLDSYWPGHTVDICVGVPTARAVSAEVYRLGYYGGAGARLVASFGAKTVAATSSPIVNATTGELRFDWPVAFTFTVGADWVSGIYFVKLMSNGYHGFAQFVVRNNRGADICYQQPVTTYAAYTPTPLGTGKSFYDYNSGTTTTTSGSQRAVTINLDRPTGNGGAGRFFLFERELVMFLEQQGYDVEYVTGLDIDADPAELLRHKIILSAGHDEYWTQTMQDGWMAARDAGVHVAYFGSNACYWRIKVEPGLDGRRSRRLTCYKGASSDPGSPITNRFRDVGQREDRLWGVQYEMLGYINRPIVPDNTGHWFWAGTGASSGVPLSTNIIGYEIDSRQSTLPPNTENAILAASPFNNSQIIVGPGGEPAESSPTISRTAHTSIYRSTSGAWVWASGTLSWAWALGRSGYVSSAIMQATRNVLDRMLTDSGVPAPPGTIPVQTTLPATTTTTAGVACASPISDTWVGTSGIAGRIVRLYGAYFRRDPDVAGFDFWLKKIKAGKWTNTGASNFFSTSPEFVRMYGANLTDSQFIDLVYNNVMCRAADAEGRAFWLNKMAHGMSRGEVVLRFSDSPEYKAFTRTS